MNLLQRKRSLREAYADKLRERGQFYSTLKRAYINRGKPLKKASKSQRRKLSKYIPIRDEFLRQNSSCQICPCRGRRPNRATEVHHSRGRIGRLMCDTRFFVASCRDCREWPHEHPNEARSLGLLASARDWNVVPKDEGCGDNLSVNKG